MQIVGTCKHCEDGRLGFSVCPSCWGTTVSPDALDKARAELAALRKAYEDKRKANKSLRGHARGMGGHALSQIGRMGRALSTEVSRIEAEIVKNKAVARVVGIAASS